MSGFRVFVVSFLLGFVVCYLIFCQNHNIKNTTLLVEKNSDEITSPPTTTTKQTHRQISLTTKIPTPHYGLMQVHQTLDRSALQYRHSLGVEGGYWWKSRLSFVGVNYEYKHYLISAKVGYSMMLREIDFGMSIGAKFSF